MVHIRHRAEDAPGARAVLDVMELQVLEAVKEASVADLKFKLDVMLVLQGESLDPDAITQQLSLQPSKSYRKGDSMPGAHKMPPEVRARLYKHGSWQLKSRLEPQSELEEHVRDLLEQVRPCQDAMRVLAQQYGGDIDCAAYGYEYVPALWLPAEILAEVGALGLSLGISVYDFTELHHTDEPEA